MATFGGRFGRQEEERYYDLQNLCLSVIITNFDKYFAAFNMPNSNVPRKYLEFLVRRYSHVLFVRLKGKRLLRMQHIDVLINRHLKELDIVKIEPSLLPRIIEKLKTHGSSILSLKASSKGLEERFCELLISCLPNVEKIEFSAYTPSEIFKHIGRNSIRLKDFKLRNFQVWESTECGYNDGVAFIIGHCPLLEAVQYHDTVGALYELHKTDLADMSEENYSFKEGKKYALKSLCSTDRNYSLSDALGVCFVTCPYVSDLYIEDLTSNTALEKMSHLPMLENVVFHQISSISVSCFSQFLSVRGSKLISLEMPYNSCLSISTLIDSCPKLQSLKLCYVRLGNVTGGSSEPPTNGHLPKLEKLEFTRGDFTNNRVATAVNVILSAAKNLKMLSLRGSFGLTREFVAGLNLCSVHELDLRFSDIEMHSLVGLLYHGNLTKLNVQGCRKITDDDYYRLTVCVEANR